MAEKKTKEELEKERAEKMKTAKRYLSNLANALGVEPDSVDIEAIANNVLDEME